MRELTAGKGVDRISEVNFFANLDAIYNAAGPRCGVGVYGSGNQAEGTMSVLPFIFGHVSLRFIQCNIISNELRATATRDITEWARSGKLVHSVGEVFDLADIATAHEAVEEGRVMGNVLVRI